MITERTGEPGRIILEIASLTGTNPGRGMRRNSITRTWPKIDNNNKAANDPPIKPLVILMSRVAISASNASPPAAASMLNR